MPLFRVLSGGATLVRWLVRLALAAAVLLALAVALDSQGEPRSTLMLGRALTGKPVDRRWTPLEAMSPRLIAAVLMSEDGQFCRHNGVDWGALRDVFRRGQGTPSRGASTLTMQVAKNLFLWPGRSYLRKAVEIPLALALPNPFLRDPRRPGRVHRMLAARIVDLAADAGPYTACVD